MASDEPQWFQDMRQRELDQFKPGTEVVVTLHGECKRGVLHGEQEIGVRGVVVGVKQDDNHPLLVYFRHPLPLTRSLLRSSYYASGELKVFDLLTDIDWTDEERAALAASRATAAGEGSE
jgi:hypothetical protein